MNVKDSDNLLQLTRVRAIYIAWTLALIAATIIVATSHLTSALSSYRSPGQSTAFYSMSQSAPMPSGQCVTVGVNTPHWQLAGSNGANNGNDITLGSDGSTVYFQPGTYLIKEVLAFTPFNSTGAVRLYEGNCVNNVAPAGSVGGDSSPMSFTVGQGYNDWYSGSWQTTFASAGHSQFQVMAIGDSTPDTIGSMTLSITRLQ